MPKIIPQEVYEQVIELYLAGTTHRAIQKKLNIARATIRAMIEFHKLPDADFPGGKRWSHKSKVEPKREFGIDWEKELPAPQIMQVDERITGRRKPIEYVRCKSCGAKIVAKFPCVSCYQKLVCFSDQDCYFRELQAIDQLAFPVPLTRSVENG